MIAIICDGNRTNPSFLQVNCLLFGFVHLLKCLRNDWITDRVGELI